MSTAGVALGTAVALLVGACGTPETSQEGPAATSATSAATTTAAPTTMPAPVLAVTDAWAPPSVPGATVGAAFLTVANPTAQADALVAATVEPSVARSVQLQQQAQAKGASRLGGSGPRAATAILAHGSQVQRLEVPAGTTVTFDHATGHLVLVGLAAPLAPGATFPMSLQFENAGTLSITVTVRDG